MILITVYEFHEFYYILYIEVYYLYNIIYSAIMI